MHTNRRDLKNAKESTARDKKEKPLSCLRSRRPHWLWTQSQSRGTWIPYRYCTEFFCQENLELNLLCMFTKLSLGTSIMILFLSGSKRGQRRSDVKKDTLAVRRQVTHLANILHSISPQVAWSSVFLLKVSYHL